MMAGGTSILPHPTGNASANTGQLRKKTQKVPVKRSGQTSFFFCCGNHETPSKLEDGPKNANDTVHVSKTGSFSISVFVQHFMYRATYRCFLQLGHFMYRATSLFVQLGHFCRATYRCFLAPERGKYERRHTKIPFLSSL